MARPCLLILALAAGCAAPAPPPPAAPLVAVAGCATAPCLVDVGDVDLGIDVTTAIEVTNLTAAPLPLDLTLAGDPGFALKDPPAEIGAGLTFDVVVDVRTASVAPIASTLSSGGIELAVVTARGVDRGVARMVVAPAACAFGDVGVGGAAVCELVITNGGAGDLIVDEASIEPAAAAFAIVGRAPAPGDEAIGVDGARTVAVRFAPADAGAHTGTLTLRSNDASAPAIAVALTGAGVLAPTCVAQIASVNGAAGASTIAPFDGVTLTLAGSTAGAGAGAIVGYRWRDGVVGPPGSRAALAGVNGAEATIVPEAPGQYCAVAEVVDDAGHASVNECAVCFDAVPQPNGLHVELTWDTSDNDMDLHVTKKDGAGQFCVNDTSGAVPTGLVTSAGCGDLDCNYATCKAADNPRTEWDSVDGVTAGDPLLAIDDIDGFGPELTDVDVPVDGDYLVGVDEYQGTSVGPATATVRVFVRGHLAAQLSKLLDVGDWAEFVVVHWPADAGAPVCIEDLTDGDATDDCP